jgi:hypothetical protein
MDKRIDRSTICFGKLLSQPRITSNVKSPRTYCRHARNACSPVDLVLAFVFNTRAVDIDGIRPWRFSSRKRVAPFPPNWGTPSYSRRIMSSTAYFLRRHTSKGRVASLRRFIRVFSVESLTLISAYQMVCSSVKCPSITSRPSSCFCRHTHVAHEVSSRIAASDKSGHMVIRSPQSALRVITSMSSQLQTEPDMEQRSACRPARVHGRRRSRTTLRLLGQHRRRQQRGRQRSPASVP